MDLPALVLEQFPPLLSKLSPGPALLIRVSMSWLLFLLSWLVFAGLGRRLGWTRATVGALVLCAGLGNTSFVGFPPLVALLVASVWFLAGSPAYEQFSPALSKLAATLVPLALFAVGFRLEARPDLLKRRYRHLALGLVFKLAIAPLIFAALYVALLGQHGLVVRVTILESAMASMVTSAIVATEFGLDAEIANPLVGTSIPISLVTVPLLNKLLGSL